MYSGKAESLCELFLQALQKHGLNYKSKLIGQCFHGITNVIEMKNGLNKKIQAKANKALYLHCYSDKLDSSLRNACYQIRIARNSLCALDLFREFMDGLGKKFELFDRIQAPEYATNLKHLTDQRWSSPTTSLSAMRQGLVSVLEFLKLISETENNAAGIEASKLLSRCDDFDFLFCVHVLDEVFKKIHCLNNCLQSNAIDLSFLLEIADISINLLIEMRNDDISYQKLVESVLEYADQNGIVLPKYHKSIQEQQAKRIRSETDPPNHYHEQFKDIIDVVVNHLREKFHSDNYKPLIAISALLTSTEKPDLTDVFLNLIIFCDDYNSNAIESELSDWYDFKRKNNLRTIADIQQAFSDKNLKTLFPNLFALLSIYLTVPISSATDDESFSCLKKLKSWLRFQRRTPEHIKQEQLSSLAITHINSEKLMNLETQTLVEIFASHKGKRLEFY